MGRGAAASVALVALLTWGATAAAVPPDAAEWSEPPPLILSEVMVNPTGDDLGQEWVELFNLGEEPVSLAGVAFEVVDVGVLVVGDVTDAVVAGRSYVLLGAHDPDYPPWPTAASARLLVDVPIHGDALLPNGQGTIRLLWYGFVLDAFEWGAPETPVAAGAAFNREPVWERDDVSVAAPGADLGEWCLASAFAAGGDTDRGTPGEPNTWCDSDGDGFAEDEGDCDDAVLNVAPDATEVCNGRDDDCNGIADEDAAVPVTVACFGEGVCRDVRPECAGVAGWRCPYPTSFEEDEVSCDGADNDCDGETDEGLRNACGKCGALPEDRCDGVDDDCDGETDEDAIGQPQSGGAGCVGVGVCVSSVLRCAGLDGWICVRPPEWEADDEASCDGRDNDCDGETDEPFDVGGGCQAGLGVCAAVGVWTCAASGDGRTCDAVPGPAGRERCGNGLDDDCDGSTDEGFALGAECVVGSGACRTRGKLVCSGDGLGTMCSATLQEPTEEVCGNGRDDDCDGETDEAGCADEGGTPPPVDSAGCAASGDAAPRLLETLLLCLLLLVVSLSLALVRRRRSRLPNPVR